MAGCENYTIGDSLCENFSLAEDRDLPKLEVDDILVFHDTGAHGLAMESNYNGRLGCAEILLNEDGSHEMIRRAKNLVEYVGPQDVQGAAFEAMLRELVKNSLTNGQGPNHQQFMRDTIALYQRVLASVDGKS